MIVGIITTGPEEREPMVLDIAVNEHRDRLLRHLWWAASNGYVVRIEKFSDMQMRAIEESVQ